MMLVTTLSGSIRSSSSNQKLLLALKTYWPGESSWCHFDISQLPFFDPDAQFENTPNVVKSLRKTINESDLVIISTPEYAHGIPGILKNALEWLICEETMKKKAAIFIVTSGDGDYVKVNLVETLRTMDWIVIPEINVIRWARNGISDSGEISDARLREILLKSIASLVKRNLKI